MPFDRRLELFNVLSPPFPKRGLGLSISLLSLLGRCIYLGSCKRLCIVVAISQESSHRLSPTLPFLDLGWFLCEIWVISLIGGLVEFLLLRVLHFGDRWNVLEAGHGLDSNGAVTRYSCVVVNISHAITPRQDWTSVAEQFDAAHALRLPGQQHSSLAVWVVSAGSKRRGSAPTRFTGANGRACGPHRYRLCRSIYGELNVR